MIYWLLILAPRSYQGKIKVIKMCFDLETLLLLQRPSAKTLRFTQCWVRG